MRVDLFKEKGNTFYLYFLLTELGRSVRENLDRGQDSPIQTDLARLIRCLLYGQIRNQKDRKNLFVPLCGLKHLAGLLLSLDSSPNGTKILLCKVQLCTNFVNE